MTELLIGVIGVGGRGSLAANAHNIFPGVRLVGGADIVDEYLEDFGKKYDCFTTNDYRELLKRPEIGAVFVTTPDYCHEEHAVAALQAGKAVYLEKPMAITIEGCDRILRTAMETGSKLYVGHNMRHFSIIQKMKEIIDSGAIGDVKAAWCRHFISYGGDAYFKDWHADRRNSTGLLLQKAAHDIDVIHWLVGSHTTRVAAMGKLSLYGENTNRLKPGDFVPHAQFNLKNWPPEDQTGLYPIVDVEDISAMLMEMENGVQATYQQCHFTPDAWRNYTVIGTRGRIENQEDGNGRVVVWNKRFDGCNSNGDIVYDIMPETGSHSGADPKIVEEFVRYVLYGIPTLTSPLAARYAVSAGVAATESIRDGNTPRAIPPIADDLVEYFSK
jgi:predicted dehydrogenase